MSSGRDDISMTATADDQSTYVVAPQGLLDVNVTVWARHRRVLEPLLIGSLLLKLGYELADVISS